MGEHDQRGVGEYDIRDKQKDVTTVEVKVNEISYEVERLDKKLEELKKMGASNLEEKEHHHEINNSPFCDEIVGKYVPNDFKVPNLPSYDGIGNSQKYVNKFEKIIWLYALTNAQKAQIFVTTPDDVADEWFTSLVPKTMVNYTQLIRKIFCHFASQKRPKRPCTYLLAIQQRDDKPLREFKERFNNELLVGQKLTVDLKVSILLNNLRHENFRSKLSRNPPKTEGYRMQRESTKMRLRLKRTHNCSKDKDHLTEECVLLKNEIESLIQ
ncbi:hypothetical protein CDL12_06239 [Handroanthus impetiginosus]|uniref:Retrotransposon gag domain-containing protein n=1 Tax=Handroanthus impetiginosus TaxID=429701 RepID=A0A2G9HU84_9LAMI|nr:hypothetical protein CDL12_06239 [Handroanthus impetiginosus]